MSNKKLSLLFIELSVLIGYSSTKFKVWSSWSWSVMNINWKCFCTLAFKLCRIFVSEKQLKCQVFNEDLVLPTHHLKRTDELRYTLTLCHLKKQLKCLTHFLVNWYSLACRSEAERLKRRVEGERFVNMSFKV